MSLEGKDGVRRDGILEIPRAFNRREVQWDAFLRIGDFVTGGVIKDYSPGGAFWSPRVIMVEPLATGARGEIRILRGPSHPEEHDSAQIRWIGYSNTHACFGFGLQFDHPAPDECSA